MRLHIRKFWQRLTGISSMGLMGPLVCVPTSLYFWEIAKSMTFLM
jgi:hypothetical protein